MFGFVNILLENNSISFNICIALLIIYLVYYVTNIISYPRGPFPLPIVGNALTFRGKFSDSPALNKFSEWAKKYGPIYTMWAGHTPIIVVSNFELYHEASVVKKNDFIHRPDSIIHKLIRGGNHNIFSTNGPYWEALRKVALFATRKFAVSERLPQIVNEVMDEAVDLMVNEKQINPTLYIDFMIYNILALTAYGKKIGSIDDQLFKDAKIINDGFYEITGNGLISEYIPWLRPFYYKKELTLKGWLKKSTDITKSTFYEHKKTFTPGVIRDFSDCVLEAKEEAIRENFSRKDFLDDENLFMVVSDLFQAGTDTTQTAMRWAVLLLANDPSLQQRIYEEIRDNIGDRFPTQEDKNILPFTYAFLLEVLRFRPSSPFGVDHMTGVDTELGGYKIPKNTTVLFNLYEQNNDPKYWTNPETVNPNRFFDSEGKLITSRLPSYVTFGLGRRNCPGEKLALNNAFLMIARLVQRMKIELPTGAGTGNVSPLNLIVGCFPRDYQIVCSLR